jgi:hypothetical protein
MVKFNGYKFNKKRGIGKMVNKEKVRAYKHPRRSYLSQRRFGEYIGTEFIVRHSANNKKSIELGNPGKPFEWIGPYVNPV